MTLDQLKQRHHDHNSNRGNGCIISVGSFGNHYGIVISGGNGNGYGYGYSVSSGDGDGYGEGYGCGFSHGSGMDSLIKT